MAGKIIADTLEHSTAGSVSTQYVVEGSAKMWVSFSTASGTPTAYDSLNVSSFTDAAAGRTTITLANNMNNNDWAGFGHSSGNTNADSPGQIAENSAILHDRTTSDGELDVWSPPTNAMADATLNDASIHGDLA